MRRLKEKVMPLEYVKNHTYHAEYRKESALMIGGMYEPREDYD